MATVILDESPPEPLELSVYTQFLIRHPYTACSRRMITHMGDVHRMSRHIAAWRSVVEPTVIAEKKLRVTPSVAADAVRMVQTETYDAIILSFGNGVWGTDSFSAPHGTLAYAIGPSGAKRMLVNAIPVEQHIDALLLTLSQLRIVAIHQHPSAVQLNSVALRSQRFLRPVDFFQYKKSFCSHSNIRTILPNVPLIKMKWVFLLSLAILIGVYGIMYRRRTNIRT